MHKVVDYYTIDFETANSSLTSACSIGIVGVSGKSIILEKYYLINPQEPFDPFNIAIHHITPKEVAKALTFDVLWEEIKVYFSNTTIFAHNAGFDISVLKAVLEKHNLNKPTFHFGCSVKMAQQLWCDKEMPNHRLHTVAGYLGVSFNHHHALSDALVIVDIINRGMRMHQVDDVFALYHAVNLRFGLFSPVNYYGTHKLQRHCQVTNDNCASLLCGKLIALSGKPKSCKKKILIEALESHGAHIDSKFSNRCDVLILLYNYHEKDMTMATLLIEQGVKILLLNEDTVIETINSAKKQNGC